MEMMEHEDISNANLAGHLLVAAPYLEGGGFHHSVIFLSRVEEEFVIGYILNHPANMTVGDVAPSTDIPASLYSVPIFKGGPVERNQLIFAAFSRTEEKLRVQFHLQEEQALEYAEDPHVMLRAYGWAQRMDAAPAAQGAERPRVVRFPHGSGPLPGAGLFQGVGHGHAPPVPAAPDHEPRARTAFLELIPPVMSIQQNLEHIISRIPRRGSTRRTPGRVRQPGSRQQNVSGLRHPDLL